MFKPEFQWAPNSKPQFSVSNEKLEGNPSVPVDVEAGF